MKTYQDAPVFHLTEEDMKLPFEEVFERYEDIIKYYGVGKFVTPPSFNPRKSGYHDAIKDMMVSLWYNEGERLLGSCVSR